MAMETFDEILNYSGNKKYIKKALKLQKAFLERISALNETEFRAQSKAEELKSSKTTFT